MLQRAIVAWTFGVILATGMGLSSHKRGAAQEGKVPPVCTLRSAVSLKTKAIQGEDPFGGIRIVPPQGILLQGIIVEVPFMATPLWQEAIKTKPSHIIRQKRAPMRDWKFEPSAPEDPNVKPPNKETPKPRSPSHYPEGIQNPRIPWYERTPSRSP